MLVGVYKGGDAALVYGCKVGEEHVEAARPAVRLLGSTLYMGERCGVS